MKRFIYLLMLALSQVNTIAQKTIIKNYQKVQVKPAAFKFTDFGTVYKEAMLYFQEGCEDSALTLSKELLSYAQAHNNDSLEALAYKVMGNCYRLKSDYSTALKYYLLGIQHCKGKKPASSVMAMLYNNCANIYGLVGNNEKALSYLKKAEKLIPSIAIYDSRTPIYIWESLAEQYYKQHQYDSSLYYLNIAQSHNETLKENYIETAIVSFYGEIYGKIGNGDSAEFYFHKAIQLSQFLQNPKHTAYIYTQYSTYLLAQNKIKKAYSYALKALDLSIRNDFLENIVSATDLLRIISEKWGDLSKAYYYACLEKKYNDSIFNQTMLASFYTIAFLQYQDDIKKDLEEKHLQEQRKKNLQFLIITFFVVLVTPSLFMFAFVSKNLRLVPYFVAISLVIIFTYLHFSFAPILDNITHDSLYLTFPALVIVTALLVPIHHRLEERGKSWMERLIRAKNKTRHYKLFRYKKKD